MGWTPDGTAILFRSLRDADGIRSEGRLYTVPLKGGLPKALPMPTSGAGDFSPDGKRLAYSPLFRDFRTWKRYEGGWAQDLYVYDLATERCEALRRNETHRARPDVDRRRRLLRVRPRRHAQPLLVRPRDRGGHEAHEQHDLGRALAVVRQCLAHRLRAGRRAARLRRPRAGRPGPLDLRPERRGRHAARRASAPRSGSRTSSSARRASGRSWWPAATCSRCRSRRAPPGTSRAHRTPTTSGRAGRRTASVSPSSPTAAARTRSG